MFEEKLITCPYNVAHKIIPHRMARHLVKCQKQHPNVSVKICPFNQTHHVPTSYYDRHVQTCSDRVNLQDPVIVHPYGKQEVENAKPPTGHRYQRRADEEDWEPEMTATPYDPQKKCLENKVVRGIQGATKSERKKFREDEKARHQELDRQKFHDSSIPGLPPQNLDTTLRRPMSMNTSNTGLRRPSLIDKPSSIPAGDPSLNRSERAIAAARSMFTVNDAYGVTAVGRGRQMSQGVSAVGRFDRCRAILEKSMTTKK